MAKEVVDIDRLIERVDGDADLFADVVELFLERSTEALGRVQQAIITRDTDGLEASAHNLRGYFVSVHAERASQVALELEIKGRRNDDVGVRYLFSKLVEEVELLKPILAQFIQKG